MEADTSPADTGVIAAQQADAPWNDEAGRWLSYKGYLHLVGGNVRHHCEILKKYINYKLKTTLINRIVNRPRIYPTNFENVMIYFSEQ